MNKLVFNIFEPIKRRRVFSIFIIIATIAVVILAIFSAKNFNNGVLVIDLKNVTYVRFLKGDCGFMSFIFMTILSVAIFYTIILLCCSKKFLVPIAIIFYLYFVYSQVVILITLMLLYGFFNVLILFIFMTIYLLMLFAVMLILFVTLFNLSGDSCYFKTCFSFQCGVVQISLILIALIILFCIVLSLLKSFVILLIF